MHYAFGWMSVSLYSHGSAGRFPISTGTAFVLAWLRELFNLPLTLTGDITVRDSVRENSVAENRVFSASGNLAMQRDFLFRPLLVIYSPV